MVLRRRLGGIMSAAGRQDDQWLNDLSRRMVHNTGFKKSLPAWALVERRGTRLTVKTYGDGQWFRAGQLADTLSVSEVGELEGIYGRNEVQLGQSIGAFLRAHKGQRVAGRVLERSVKRRGAGYGWRFSRPQKGQV